MKNELVETLTKEILSEAATPVKMTVQQQSTMAGEVASGQVMTRAVSRRMAKLMGSDSTSMLPSLGEPQKFSGQDSIIEDYLGEAMQHAKTAAGTLDEIGHKEAQVFALRLRLAKQSLEAHDYPEVLYQLRELFNGCDSAMYQVAELP